MGFFDKVKKWFGVGGVKMKVEMDSIQLSKGGGSVSGKAVLTSQSNQIITELNVKVREDWSTGRGEEKRTKTFVLGETTIAQNIEIASGETKEYAFTCDYETLKSENDRMKEGGAVSKTLGKLGSMMDNEKSTYEIVVSCDVRGVLMSPSSSIGAQMN